MPSVIWPIVVFLVAFLAPILPLRALEPVSEGPLSVGIHEQLGDTLPLDLVLRDEEGQSVPLRDLIKKPTLLGFVYYRCPGICSPFLGSVATLVDEIAAKAGEDFDVLTVSFDETDTPELAKKKKGNYLKTLKRAVPENSWHFLTGDLPTIEALTRAAGFGFKRDGKDFIHSVALIVLSPQGKIVRYLYGSNNVAANPETGLRFLPFDVKLALFEAQEGRVGPAVGRILQYCFDYDPSGRRYVLNVTRLAGGAVSLSGLSYLLYLVTRKKKNKAG